MFNPLIKKSVISTLFLTSLLTLGSIHSVNADDDFTDSQPMMEQNATDSDYDKTLEAFRSSKAGNFFDHAYGYAVFPTIGKVGFILGGAYGQGRVYENEVFSGTSEMHQGTIGFQFGGQAFSQIIFFQDQRAYDEFTNENFEFGASASAVVLNAGVSAEASTKGTSATANAGTVYVKAEGQYYKGMAVFSIAKGGLMYEAVIGGQKYTFEPN